MNLKFRIAKKEDLPTIVQMLADDNLGKQREDYRSPLPEAYIIAFDIITTDPHQELLVVESDNDSILGTLQMSYIQYLTYQGGTRAQIEAVRIRKDLRGKGIGKQIFEWAIQHAKTKGAHLLQLTTDKQRPEAIHFYQKLGFKASHEGMKLHFDS